MDENEIPWDEDSFDDSPEIPRLFYSEYLEGPFQRCIDCEKELLEADVPYMIQKQFVGKEAVYELAMCLPCQRRLATEVSDETRQSIQKFLESLRGSDENHVEINIDSSDPAALDLAFSDPHLLMINQCLLCDAKRSECHRYGVAGMFINDRTVISPGQFGMQIPMLLCDGCATKMNECMSRETRDMWDRFVQDHLDGPPGLEKDVPKPDFVMM